MQNTLQIQIRLYVNQRYAYVIKSIEDKVIIYEPIDKEICISHEILKKHLKLPYANTFDNVQGLNIDDKITLFDCNTPYVDRYFIWTAITRASVLKNVQIYEHSDEEVMNLNRFVGETIF